MMMEKSDHPFTSNSFGDRFIYQVNRNDFDHLGADYVFRERFGIDLFKQDTLYLLVGSDSLLLPAYIERNGIPTGSNYIFVEPESIYALIEPYAKGLNKHFRITPPTELQQALDEVGSLGADHYIYKDQVEIVESIAAINDYIEQYAALNVSLSNTMATLHWDVCGKLNLAQHIANIIETCPNHLVSSVFLKGIFSGKSVVILAGGPSLEENFPWLEQHRDSLVVIAVSRISLRLHELNIQPDIFIHADAQEIGFDTAKGIFYFPDTLFTYTANSPPRLIGQWDGMSAIITERLPWSSTINDCSNIEVEGNSVTNVAISLAAKLGASQIILLGVDLCHSPEGFSHAAGSNERRNPPPIHLNLDRVTTNDSGVGYTTQDFTIATKALDRQAQRLNAQGIRLINPSPNAVKLTHVEYHPVAEVTLEKLTCSPLQLIAAAYPKPDPNIYLDHLTQELNHAGHQIRALQLSARKAISGLNQAKKKPKAAEEAFKVAQKMTVKTTKNGVAKAAIAMHLSRFVEFLSIIESGENGYEQGILGQEAYLSHFLEVSQLFDTLLKNTLERVEVRKEELKESPRFDLLFKQWAADNQPGRAALWMKNHLSAQTTLPPDIQHQLQAFSEHFNAEVREKRTRHLSTVGAMANLDNVIPRVILLFKSKDVDGFNYLLSILSHYPDGEARPYSLFTSGMLAELEGHPGQAIIYYQQILECPESPALELTLKRIAGICIEAGDMENALFAFESLAGLSAEHAPSYAELLAAMGHIGDAVAVYEEYCASYPDDLATRCKFGLLYKEIGESKKAGEIGRIILADHPDFIPAKELIRV
ncbi:MAG: 6-hydroxymethylpterin diphosphokinase MptE-like protein [Candidatus Sedimenticola sp. (ex Thyasira tokunagai)]